MYKLNVAKFPAHRFPLPISISIDNPRDKKNGLNPKNRLLDTVRIPFLKEMSLVDPFREQIPNRIVWSFVANENSRIERVYIDSASMGRVTNLKYIYFSWSPGFVFSFEKLSGEELFQTFFSQFEV